MGLFSKLFGNDRSNPSGGSGRAGAADDPADVRRDGAQVIRPDETLPITGRGVVVTGELLMPVQVGDKCDVTHRGSTESMRLITIMIDKVEQESAATGATVTLLINRPVRPF